MSGGETLRRGVLALVLLGMAGLAAELFLLEHTEDFLQWLPLAALAAGFACGVAVAFRPTPGALRLFQAIMAVFVVTGGLGLFLHYLSNTEFEREMDASLRGTALFWEAMHGATPTLAPGALAQLGLLGLLFTFRHPAFRPRTAPADGLHPDHPPTRGT